MFTHPLHPHLQEFPEIDRALIEGMMEDQGGEMHDVRFFLKKMRKDVRPPAPQFRLARRDASLQSAAAHGPGR